jgi:hypothetical protein
MNPSMNPYVTPSVIDEANDFDRYTAHTFVDIFRSELPSVTPSVNP